MRHIGALMLWREIDPFSQKSRTAFEQALGRFGWVEGKNIRIDHRFAAGDPALFKPYAEELGRVVPGRISSRRRAGGRGAAATDAHNTDRFCIRGRSRRAGPCSEPRTARRQRYGVQLLRHSRVGKMAAFAQGGRAGPDAGRCYIQPEHYALAFFNRGIRTRRRVLGDFCGTCSSARRAAVEQAIAAQAREPGGDLISLPDSFTEAHRDVIIAAATRHRLPLIGTSTFPRSGGLMSYWLDPVDLYAQAASYIDRILRGASPADLPVQNPTKYSLIINLKTAKALGLDLPERVLDVADEVIE
jgi:putative ABC transport system substrate-binding protein